MRPTLRTAFMVVAATAFALLTAACGGGGERDASQPAATASGAGKDVRADIVGENLLFDKDRIEVPAGSRVKIVFDNRDTGVLHNFAAYETSEAKELLEGTDLEAGPVVQELTFEAPPPGEYFFRCDAHPTTMLGTLVVT